MVLGGSRYALPVLRRLIVLAYMLLPVTIYRIILHINIQMNTVTSVLLIRKKPWMQLGS